VDAQTRLGLEDLILRVRDEFGVTVVFVTHDIDEAVYLADRVIVLSASPGVVSEVIDIALQRPRDQVTTKRDETFAAYREHLLGLVMSHKTTPILRQRLTRRPARRPGHRLPAQDLVYPRA